MPNENGLKAQIKNTIDTSKIQRLMTEANVQILVGYPSGMEHVQQLHRENRKEELHDLEGNTADQTIPIETSKLAMMLHFGTADIPARPFLTDALRQKSGFLKKLIQEQVQKLAEGKRANWNLIGVNAVGAVNELVRSDYYKQRKPNSKKTIKHKKSDTPLIDSAAMLQSTAYVLNGGDPKFPLRKGGGS